MEAPRGDDDHSPDYDNARFESIAEGYTGLEKEQDPEVAALFEAAERAERRINDPDVTEPEIQELLVSLNTELCRLGMKMNTIMVSGRLRPTSTLAEDEVDLEDELDEVVTGPWTDARGAYYEMKATPLRATSYDVLEEKVRGGSGLPGYKYNHVVLGFAKPSNYTEDTAWFVAHHGDVGLIELPFNSDAADERILRRLLPDLVSQIDTAIDSIESNPDGKPRETLVLELLRDLKLVVNWSIVDGSEYTRYHLVEMLSDYITRRLDLDKEEPYIISMDGPWKGFNYKVEAIESSYHGDVIARIDKITIDEASSTKNGMVVEYGAIVTIRLPMSSDNAGHTPVEIPAGSITDLRSTRSREPFFSEDTYVDHSIDEKLPILDNHSVAANGCEFIDPKTIVDNDAGLLDDDKFGVVDPEKVQDLLDRFTVTGNDIVEQLTKTQSHIDEIVSFYSSVKGVTYTKEECSEVASEMNERLIVLDKLLRYYRPSLSLYGEGFYYSDAQVDIKTESPEVPYVASITGYSHQKSSLFYERIGLYKDFRVQAQYDKNTDRYSIVPTLIIVDSPSYTTTVDQSENVPPTVVVSVDKLIHANLSENVNIRLTELDRMQRCTNVFKAWDANGELDGVPKVREILIAVAAEMIEASHEDWHILGSVDGLKSLGKSLQLPRDNSSATPETIELEATSITTCNMLRDIFSPGRTIGLVAETYNGDGSPFISEDEVTNLTIRLIDFIPESRYLEVREPMIVGCEIDEDGGVDTSKLVYVPLRTIDELII